MANRLYNSAMGLLIDGTIDLDNDTIKVMLVDSNYTFDPDHENVDDASGDELSGTGYTAGFGMTGRKTLTTPVVAVDDINDKVTFDADDSSWTGLNAGPVGGIVLIKEVSTDADSNLIAFVDTASPNLPQDPAGDNFVVSWDAVDLIISVTSP